MTEKKILQVDVEEVVKQKSPRLFKKIPGFVFNFIKRTIQQDRINRFLKAYPDVRGIDFAETLLEYLDITLRLDGEKNIPSKGRFIFASNHPLGGLDGVALISVLGRRYNKDIKFVVNDLLMAIEPLSDNFLPINKYGKQDKDKADALGRAYEGNGQMAVFPAGLVSRRQGKEICDLTWNKAFIAKSVQYQRDVIPVWFEGYNSKLLLSLRPMEKTFGSEIQHRIDLSARRNVQKRKENIYYTLWQTHSLANFR